MKNIFKFFFKFFWKNRIAGFLALIFWMALITLMFEPFLKFLIDREEGYIPDVQGMTKENALSLLSNEGFFAEVVDVDYIDGCNENTVLSTYPTSPQKINKNRTIEVNVYKKRGKVRVERYIDLNIKEAKRLAKNNKLKLEVNYYVDGNDSLGVISRQYPKYNISNIYEDYIYEGSVISVWVCNQRPPDEYIVPDVIGKSLNEAVKDLEISGFLIGDISYINKKDFLENTVYEISYITSGGYSVEVLEGLKYTVPIRIDIKVTKDGE